MNRKDRVSDKLKELCSKFKKEYILEHKVAGYSASDIAYHIGSQRNNITSDLNALHKEGKIIKIIGKPTLFFDKEVFERIFNVTLKDDIISCKHLLEILKTAELANRNKKYTLKNLKEVDAFRHIIGSDGSLSSAVKQAKAAVLYPPTGIHTLILGETGIGKSTFAEAMHKYGVSEGVWDLASSPFITFNCADYASNPQLIVSQLFGYNKGSFTGANEDKAGLIESANGGVLFLDEVHRLPPEGQEMLFTFIDKGIFKRLGEVDKERTAKVLIVAATTETPESILLKTFLRRIPMIIKLPPLKDRGLNEKLALINKFFDIEATRLAHDIFVDKEVIEALAAYNPIGNIGQLKSDIQLSAARAFLELKLNNLDNIHITLNFIPEYVKSGLLSLDKKLRCNLSKTFIENKYCFKPNQKSSIYGESKESFIKYYTEILKMNRYSENAVQNFLYAMSQSADSENKFSDLIDEDIADMLNIISDIVYNDLGVAFEKGIYQTLALHLAYIKHYDMKDIDNVQMLNGEEIKVKYPQIHRASLKIMQRLGRDYKINWPIYEANFLTIIFSSLVDKKDESAVGIIVIAHGDKTASNMANAVNELLGISHVNAIDMPLSEKPEVILNKAIDLAKKVNQGKGVLLLVDMGSLITFAEPIKKATGIDIKAVDNVSTLTVIEAARKALMPNSNLDYVVYSLVKLNQVVCEKLKRRIKEEYSGNMSKIIYTVCSSGQGTAYYLEKSIKEVLTQNQIYDAQVISLSLANVRQLKNVIEDSSEDRFVIAIIGTIDPTNGKYPFISLQEILLSNGLEKLLNLINPKLKLCNNEDYINKINREIIWGATTEALEKYLQFLSADKILPFIKEFVLNIEEQLELKMENGKIARAYIHIACMIERMLFKNNLLSPGGDFKDTFEKNRKLWISVRKSFKRTEEIFNINISENEIYFIVKLFTD